jgi:Kef-type K+ transport system membrane component KefB/Trk K+ transport system NAD-binding subunit
MDYGNVFYQVALTLAISGALGALALKLRQPLLIAFIAVGILVGPSGLNMVSMNEPLQLLAEIGIAILLFVVGLKLDLHLIRTMGRVALATGMGQVAFTSLFGFLIALALGMSTVGALYVAVALTFSSTIIIVKLLSDKREIDALHGRIAVGFLIVQDIAVVLAMILLTAVGAAEGSAHILGNFLLVLLKGSLLLAGVALIMRFVLPHLLPHLARSQELLLLSAIAWAVFLAATGDFLSFSKEVGAFLAGISLASTTYREAIASRLVSLRDFLLLFFFISLGAQLDLSTLGAQVSPAILFSAFVLIGNPLIVMAIMGYMGYRRRTGFLAGLTVAQISEFSLILGALGVSLGHIDQEILGLITLVGLITIGLSTYMIIYSHQIYARIAPWLGVFERKHPYREAGEQNARSSEHVEILLFGLGRYGRNIAKNLIRRGRKVLAVDFDPQIVSDFSDGIPVRYGDAEDPEILEHLPLQDTEWVVHAIPGRESNLTLLKALQEKGYRGKVVLTAHNEEEAESYRQAGADKVLWPFVDAAEQAVDYLTASLDQISALTPWPVTLEEIKIRPGSVAAGKKLGELALRPRTGASVVAIDRAGHSHFDPPADSFIFPGDRLILLGTQQNLREARDILEETEMVMEEGKKKFQVAEIRLDVDSPWAGETLADLDLRRRHGVSVIGIRRGEEKIVSPSSEHVLSPGDVLVAIGQADSIQSCRESQESPKDNT